MAMDILLVLLAKQREGEGGVVFESYAAAMKTYKKTFTRYGHQQFADQLPGLNAMGSTVEQRAAGNSEVSVGGSSLSIVA